MLSETMVGDTVRGRIGRVRWELDGGPNSEPVRQQTAEALDEHRLGLRRSEGIEGSCQAWRQIILGHAERFDRSRQESRIRGPGCPQVPQHPILIKLRPAIQSGQEQGPSSVGGGRMGVGRAPASEHDRPEDQQSPDSGERQLSRNGKRYRLTSFTLSARARARAPTASVSLEMAVRCVRAESARPRSSQALAA